MAGNLVDNACKWASSRVFIEVLAEPPREPGAGPMLQIIVDDDGRGLSAPERAQVARRGQRLDESKPGSGLGLSIVIDLAALYGGSLSLDNAPIGGLRAELVLPGVWTRVTVRYGRLRTLRPIRIAKRLLNTAAFIMETCGPFSGPCQRHCACRADKPEIDRAAEGLSRAASAAVAGPADPGVRARHRTRRGHDDRQPRTRTIAQSGAGNRSKMSRCRAPRTRRRCPAARALSGRQQASGSTWPDPANLAPAGVAVADPRRRARPGARVRGRAGEDA